MYVYYNSINTATLCTVLETRIRNTARFANVTVCVCVRRRLLMTHSRPNAERLTELRVSAAAVAIIAGFDRINS